jgi:hypothetical protein
VHKIKNVLSKKISTSSSLLNRYKKHPYKRVVVIQNLIYEIEQKSHECFIDNVIKCYEKLSTGSFLILIDLISYYNNCYVADQLEKRLKKDVINNFESFSKRNYRRI